MSFRNKRIKVVGRAIAKQARTLDPITCLAKPDRALVQTDLSVIKPVRLSLLLSACFLIMSRILSSIFC